MPFSEILELEETIMRIESVSNQLGMLHDCAANGANCLDNYVPAIFLMAHNLNAYCKELRDYFEKQLEKERTRR